MEYHSHNHKFYRYVYFLIEFFLAYQAANFGLYMVVGWGISFHEPILSFLFITSILWTLWISISRLYETRYLFHYENFLRRFPIVTMGVTGSIFIYCFFFTEFDYSLTYLLYNILSQLICLGLFRLAGITLYRYRRIWRKGYQPLVIGDGPLATDLLQFFQQAGTPALHYSLSPEMTSMINPLKIQKFCLDKGVSEIYLASPDHTPFLVNHLADFCENHFIYLRLTLAHENGKAHMLRHPIIGDTQPTIDVYGSAPVVTLKQYPLRPMLSQLSKRLFDVLFSLFIILCILIPATLILAILIKAESRGPVFFRQRRGGIRNETFICLKFRTMKYSPSDENLPFRQAQKDDIRITKIGTFLRKTSIDELPQFLNVLVGHMSVVGPRPHPLPLDKVYTPQIPKYSYRFFIKPGITGHAQVNGLRGETRDPKKMSQRVEHDIWYIENWSLKTDLRIIWKTLHKILKPEEFVY